MVNELSFVIVLARRHGTDQQEDCREVATARDDKDHCKLATQERFEHCTDSVKSETVEKNTHALNNSTGTANVSGVYQWVNKVYNILWSIRRIADANLVQLRSAGVQLRSPRDVVSLPEILTVSEPNSGKVTLWYPSRPHSRSRP
jgi:hypothetical protein